MHPIQKSFRKGTISAPPISLKRSLESDGTVSLHDAGSCRVRLPKYFFPKSIALHELVLIVVNKLDRDAHGSNCKLSIDNSLMKRDGVAVYCGLAEPSEVNVDCVSFDMPVFMSDSQQASIRDVCSIPIPTTSECLVFPLRESPTVAASVVMSISGTSHSYSIGVKTSALLTLRLSAHLLDMVLYPGASVRLWDDLTGVVGSTVPSSTGQFLLVTKATRVYVQHAPPSELPEQVPRQHEFEPHAAVGGLDEPLRLLRQMLLLPLAAPHALQRLGIDCPKGVLLHGPPGTGKTLLVHSVVQEVRRRCNLKLITVNGAGQAGMAGVSGATEEFLRGIFKEAQDHVGKASNSAALIFMDELDGLCPSREESTAAQARVVAQLLTLMDGMDSRGHVIVVAATNRPNAIDSALRRPGRFDREIGVPAPDAASRMAILSLACRGLPLARCAMEALPRIAADSVGYVGADIAALVREASLCAIMRAAGQVEATDFDRAMTVINPSALRGHEVEPKITSWGDVGGLASVKLQLQQAVTWPIRHAATFRRLGLASPRGILLHGPPGCSKTTLVRAVAHATSASFHSASAAEVYSPWVGDAEKAIRELFSRARASLPAIVFLDELDAMVGKRDMTGQAGDGGADSVQSRILSTLLNEMDGVEACEGLLVIGATNRPQLIDAALLRPGRFDSIIHVPLPGLAAREEILRVHMRGVPLEDGLDAAAVTSLAIRMEGFSGAEIENAVREAALLALRENMLSAVVAKDHLERAVLATRGITSLAGTDL